ncbi:methylated-DNA--[protein]-cysteine S-methyltransferase [Peptococcus simiae]|uniref:methylated-DNA--[protein]-cysteine S-methyltransferase n=1 Tax=Peptococcus simiae TaxID=1643805 RepID=UPI00397ECC3B
MAENMLDQVYFFKVQTPLGDLPALASDHFIYYLGYREEDARIFAAAHRLGLVYAASPLTAPLNRELEEYFAGQRTRFSLPIKPLGTPFQRQVWQALRDIPYGHTASYQAIAQAIGRPQASRAVGGANHRNPLSIIIPCHRVIRADGSLGGYGGGLAAKKYLLNLEQAGLEGSLAKPPEKGYDKS